MAPVAHAPCSQHRGKYSCPHPTGEKTGWGLRRRGSARTHRRLSLPLLPGLGPEARGSQHNRITRGYVGGCMESLKPPRPGQGRGGRWGPG